MDIEPQNLFRTLIEFSQNVYKGPFDCSRLLNNLDYNLTQQQLNSSQIDLYLLHMFDKTCGLFNFIFSIVSNNKFDSATVKSLEIIYTIINNFSNRIEQFILEINEKCMSIIRRNASAKVKVKALDVLIISFEKINKCIEYPETYKTVFEGIESFLISDHPDSVKQKEYIALGLFMKKFNYIIDDYNSRKMYFIQQLDKEMVQGASQGNINGIFTGFGYFCESFPLKVDDPQDSAIISKLYKYIKDLSSTKGKVRIGNRAAISFFGSNMKFFINLAIKEFKQWHKKLFVDWLDMGAEDKKVGEMALRAYLLAVSKILVEMEQNDAIPILKHFIGWLKQLMRKQNATPSEKKLSIQGLEYFCNPLYQYYSKEEAREIFLIVMQNFENSFILNENSESEDWEYLPEYVQCLASFMRFHSFTTSELYCLQRAVISMIKAFHKLKPLHYSVVINALSATFFYLKESSHLDPFLENIIYQGVVWSCSHQHISVCELFDEKDKIITVKNYFPLWKGLLKLTPQKTDDDYWDDRKYILAKIVNELVKTLLILIYKLNVNVSLRVDVIQTNIESAYQVEQSSDFSIFLNVTDFYQEVFNYIQPDMLKYYTFKMINHLVIKCLRYPLVSGFYKLLSIVLKLANNLKFFLTENPVNEDETNCKESLSKFMKVLLYKMKQFKDELLISCLQVLLESPVIVIEPLLPDCIGIFITIFEVGRSFLALANMGLNTLENWQNNMDAVEFEKFLEHVIPCLDSYLRSKSLGGLMQSNQVEKKRKTAQALKKRTVLVELEPELVKFQRRILHFIGSQNAKICHTFVCPDYNFERKVTSDTPYLKVTLPYEDLMLDIHLEHFVPRIVELSQYCSDRKTRVMACEFLQAIVMIFLGRAKQIPSSSLSDLDELLTSILKPLLELSCDIDQVVSQIFEPLMFQLIHWYTSKINNESPHLAVLISVLMEGITHPVNSSLRDFSGKCLNELVKWTIKQHTELELKNRPLNIKVLVNRMRFFGGHPDIVKKLGASLIFNNIYKEFREERFLLSIFSMEILHIFILSLSLLESLNEEVQNTVVHINHAIRHLQRIFIEKPNVFREKDELRRVPSDLPDGNLDGLSRWLLSMTASRSKYCRDICMELFIHIQPLSGTEKSYSDYARYHFPNLSSIFEQHLVKCPTLENLVQTNDCTVLIKWLQSLLCCVDGHIFMAKYSLCSVSLEENQNVTVKAVYYFLDYISTATIEEALKLICKDSTIPYYTQINKEEYLSLKSYCCVAILKLALALANDELLCEKSHEFWNKQLWNFIKNVIFNPLMLGFVDRVIEIDQVEILEVLLNVLARKLKECQVKELVQELKEYVDANFDVVINLNRIVGQKQRNILKGLLMLRRSRLNNAFNSENYCRNLIDKLMSNFYKNLDANFITVGRLSDTIIEYCNLIFEFALQIPEEFKSLLSHLYRDVTVICQDLIEYESQSSFGIYLLTTFGDVLIKFIVQNFEMFLDGSNCIELVFQLTSFVLRYLEKNKSKFCNVFHRISESIFAKWFLFELYFEENSLDAGLDFLSQLWRMFGYSSGCSENIQKWVMSLILRDELLMTSYDETTLYFNLYTVLAEIVSNDNVILSFVLERIKLKLWPTIQSYLESSNWPNKILSVLPVVKSAKIFEFILEFYLTDVINRNGIDLTYLLKQFMLNNTENFHGHILQRTYELGLNEDKTFEQKKKLSDHVLPHIFKNSSFSAFRRFFERNIMHIQNSLKNINYGNGIISFQLVELLFLRIPIGIEETDHCSVTEASGDPNLRNTLLKAGLDVFRDGDCEGAGEPVRLLKCSAYKALASMISNSIRSEKLYEQLFVREDDNGDILWRSLIDCDKSYTFPVDFDSYPKKRKILVNIRDVLREQSKSQPNSNSFKYIATQRLFKSSLSEDITKFDFSNTVLRSNPANNKSNMDQSDGGYNKETRLIQGELYLEATEVNNHELMATVCGIIEHMFKTNINYLPEDNDEMESLPNWMEGIRRLLLNPATPKNVKIFWVKVIDNMIDIFGHFAEYFMEPLLKFLNDKIAGSYINYFVTDVVVILASWTVKNRPKEIEAKLASELLQYLIENLTNDRQDAFKYNLELIKLFVENWKDFIMVPHDTIFAKINFEISDRKIEVGIHVASLFLVNRTLPCEISAIEMFWKKLVQILSSPVTTVYKPCAETIGLILNYFKMHEMENEYIFVKDIRKILLGYECINKYAGCLEGIAIHYPDILDTYHLNKIINRLSQSDQNLQTIFLKIIFRRADFVNEVVDFKSENWDRYIESQNPEIQLLALEIILKTYHILNEEKSFKDIIKSVCKNLLNPNDFCRGKMFDILMALLEMGDVIDEDVNTLCKEVLIQGLMDNDIEIREKIRKFWSESPILPSGIATKFSYLMANFYLTKTEDHFLGYSAYFLLDSIKPDYYEKELFEHPLEDCDFEEYKLQTNWRLQHPSVVPMFVETLRSYTEALDEEGPANEFGVLRATQNDYTFDPTQQTLREKHINQITSLESSLIGASVGDIGRNNKGFLNPNAINLSEKYKLPKRRFLKDKSKISSNFAHRAVGEKIQKTVKRFEAAKEKESRVTIYRSYRKGDFPDIQITLGSLIKPLQMLALHDNELSKTVFSTIYNSLYDKVRHTDEFSTSISDSIKHICTNSVQFNVTVFSTILDILLKSKDTVSVDPGLISTVCQQSGLISVGTLIIEEYIMNIDHVPSTSKRGVEVDNYETRHWLKLAELYKELNEWNLVKTIFLEKSNCRETVNRAVMFESQKRWRDAQETYEQLLKMDQSVERQYFYSESYFKCLAYLGEWEKLPKAVESILPEQKGSVWNCLWDSDRLQQKVLPWYVSAQVKIMLFSGKDSPDFLMDINKSLENTEQAEYLKNKFAEELCILWLTQKDTPQAKQCLKTSLDTFLSDWQLLNPMFGNLRYNKVLNLRNLIEIDRFLECKLVTDEDSVEQKLKSLMKYWKSTQNEFLPSIVLSESMLLYRRLFIKHLLQETVKPNHHELIKELRTTKIILDIAFMNTAIREENFYMTRQYFREYVSYNHPKLKMISGNVAYLCSQITRDPGRKLEKMLESLERFSSIETSKTDISILMRVFDLTKKTTDILTENPDLYAKYEARVSKIFGDDVSSPMNSIYDLMKSAALKNDEISARNDTSINGKSEALIKLAYFVKDKNQKEDFVLCVLRAMQLGSAEARRLFPCILLIDLINSNLEETFINETQIIPTWMFLGWIPQLLANVDSPKITCISQIILRIATTYPQAIMYSYRLWKDTVQDLETSFEETKHLIEKLDQLLLSNSMVDKFLFALSKVSVPLVAIEYYMKKMCMAANIEKVIELRDIMVKNMFSEISDSRGATNIQGNMYNSLKDFKNDFLKINIKSPISKIQELMKSMDLKRKKVLSKLENNKMSRRLQDYSPWLANFSAGRLNVDLEIPGQYSGNKLPLAQHHIKISGFCDTVTVMSSLRKPIKMTMLGMDGKEYPFLVKFGEDIRQDQRIQQLFILMNNIFTNDNKHHNILTYEVIPLTTSLGIIQWVESTVSLEDFIKKPLKSRRRTNILHDLWVKYDSLFGKGSNDPIRYGNSAINIDRNRVIAKYQELVHAIPWDVLRSSIWSMSLTTESFIAFRSNFITSYATLCVSHWILGIGDRHLQNSKICTKNGKVLGIDFGHAFGTATQLLQIPELVPIRLTPHIVGLMEPFRENGLFRNVMIDCLRSLRDNKDPLMATMNVFVQEPSVDWLEHAKKFVMSDANNDDFGQEHQWFPLQKIEQTKRKLEGASSAAIMIDDLISSHLNKLKPEFIKAYVSLVEGKSEHDLRARLGSKEVLNVEDQVDCLIDHATDRNLLGRMYAGWQPYV